MNSMLRMFGVLVTLGFLAGFLFVSSAQSAEEATLAQYKGVYMGFSPTDESAVGYGEMEFTISDKDMKIRVATGTSIHEEKTSIAEFVPMSVNEVKEMYREGSVYPARTVGFRGKAGFPKLLFLKDPVPEEFGLIVYTGGAGDVLGPTVLFNSAQIARGDYEKAIQNMEHMVGEGVLPLLRNGGKAEKKFKHP